MNSRSNQATLSFLLTRAFFELFAPRKLVIEHSFGDGFFCHEINWESISGKEVIHLEKLIHKWIRNDSPLILDELPLQSVIEELYTKKSFSKLEVVKRWNKNPVPIIRFEKYWDIRIEPMNIEKSTLGPFKLRKYDNGFLIRFPDKLSSGKIPPYKDQPKLFSTIEDHEQWGSILRVSTIMELNELIRNGEIRAMIWVAEGLHEKKISDIADSLVESFPHKRVINIAGPSSSGKTTFAKRLEIQLRVNGFRTQQISLDDYFIDRDKLPRDKFGNRDFESIKAMNVNLLCNRLDSLLSGKSIPVRDFDFIRGIGKDSSNQIKLDKWDFIVLEGIHCLNPVFSKKIGKERLNRIYVSAITQLNIDADHRVSTSDNRLLRRIVRDYKFRGYTPEETLGRWQSVRMGEERNIFPYQEQADYMFNSALVYEFPVLAGLAIPLLEAVKAEGNIQKETIRLKTLLSFFKILKENVVPGISILREFVGNSEFDY